MASRSYPRSHPDEPVIDLNAWHHAIHQVTGDMALRFNRATASDLQRWSKVLLAVAEEMDAVREGLR